MCAVNSNYMCNNNTNIQYNDSIKGMCLFWVRLTNLIALKFQFKKFLHISIYVFRNGGNSFINLSTER